jgi:hypothetical protein
MTRARCTFRLSDLTRAIKGARAAGVDVRKIRIGRDGAIEIDTMPQDAVNEWDSLREIQTPTRERRP